MLKINSKTRIPLMIIREAMDMVKDDFENLTVEYEGQEAKVSFSNFTKNVYLKDVERIDEHNWTAKRAYKNDGTHILLYAHFLVDFGSSRCTQRFWRKMLIDRKMWNYSCDYIEEIKGTIINYIKNF